jgi:hypothetical protein
MSILDPASSPMPLVTTSPQISSSRNRRFLLIVSAAALISIPLIWLWNSQRPESSPPQFQLSKAAPKNPVPTTDPFIANIEEHEANRRSAVGQKIPPQSTTPPTAPTPTVTPTEAPKPVFTKSLSQHAKPAVLEAGEFKIGDGLAIIDDLARRNGSQLGTVVEETKGRVGATADRSFSLEFIQGLSMFRRHVVTTSASPAPELAYTELGYFQFSGPESGSRSYVVGRDLGFPKKPSMQPTRTQVVSDIVSKYGRPTISISCEPINANNPRVRVLIYLYQAGRLIETDVPEFVSTIALDETIPKSNAWSSAFNDLLDIRAHNYIWIQFCLWPTRSDYRSGLSIPPFLSSKLDQMYLASTLAGETDDYVGRIHTVIFDNDAYRSLTNVDQKAIDKRHAERQTPKGVKAPL